ncbi:hypothetical protein, partial [Salmonella enterica]|uniref:hypothetical protein n=1 Tax=Salmonella enterica TaxID=28901 RepID=UPI001F41FDBC
NKMVLRQHSRETYSIFRRILDRRINNLASVRNTLRFSKAVHSDSTAPIAFKGFSNFRSEPQNFNSSTSCLTLLLEYTYQKQTDVQF